MAPSKSTVNANQMPATPKTPAAPKTAAKKAPAAKASVDVPVAAPAPAPVVAAPAPVAAVAASTPLPAETRSADALLTSVQDRLRAIGTEVTTRIREVLREAADAAKALKRESRDSKRRVRRDPATMTTEERATYDARRANNAFLKLRPISDELSTFMGLPAKSERSQTDVTKFVATYVREHSCFDPSHKRTIVPDAKLGKLLRANDGEVVTYLNLQKFLKAHFIKPATA
jgi:chromatin remodeling complex protein RSC6